jgi:MSHA biogenesis protein MshK
MDEVLNRALTRMTSTAALLAALALCAGAADAQALQDPTRPPAGAQPGEGGAGASGAPQLQSVLVGRAPNARRVAVIDGEMVRPGDSFRGARVARVSDTEVELVRGGERQVLRLYAPQAGGAEPAARQ